MIPARRHMVVKHHHLQPKLSDGKLVLHALCMDAISTVKPKKVGSVDLHPQTGQLQALLQPSTCKNNTSYMNLKNSFLRILQNYMYCHTIHVITSLFWHKAL